MIAATTYVWMVVATIPFGNTSLQLVTGDHVVYTTEKACLDIAELRAKVAEEDLKENNLITMTCWKFPIRKK